MTFTVEKTIAEIERSLRPIAPPLTVGGNSIYQFRRGGRRFLLAHEHGSAWVIRNAHPHAMIPVVLAPTLRACLEKFARGPLGRRS